MTRRVTANSQRKERLHISWGLKKNLFRLENSLIIFLPHLEHLKLDRGTERLGLSGQGRGGSQLLVLPLNCSPQQLASLDVIRVDRQDLLKKNIDRVIVILSLDGLFGSLEQFRNIHTFSSSPYGVELGRIGIVLQGVKVSRVLGALNSIPVIAYPRTLR